MTTTPLTDVPSGVDPADFDAACAEVRSYCGWHIAPSVSEPVTLDGPGGTLLRLPTLHLTALTSITNDGETVTDPEWSALGSVRLSSYPLWTCKYRGVVADITHGYDACPPEVAQVARALALRMDDATSGGRVRQVGQVAYETSGDGGGAELLESEKRVLDRYKLPPRP